MSIHVYGANARGERSVGFEVNARIRVLVIPGDSEHNGEAETVARDLYPQSKSHDSVRIELDHAKRTIARLSDRVRDLEAARDAANERAVNAATGRRRFFTAVLLAPAKPGDWSGEVWLLDPVKKHRGRGLVFANLAEVRRLHPELWVVDVCDDGLLLDAWGDTARAERDDALRRQGPPGGESRRRGAAGE